MQLSAVMQGKTVLRSLPGLALKLRQIHSAQRSPPLAMKRSQPRPQVWRFAGLAIGVLPFVRGWSLAGLGMLRRSDRDLSMALTETRPSIGA